MFFSYWLSRRNLKPCFHFLSFSGTTKPNFQVILELLKVAPELLFIVDHRGATPLAYIPRESWGIWCDFLQEQRIFLRDMVKSLRFDRARYYIKNMVPCLKF